MHSYTYRKRTNTLMLALCVLAVALAILILLLIFGYVLVKGIGSWKAAFFLNLPAPPGEPDGGIANGILGSLLLVAVASGIGIPVGIGAGIYLAEYEDRFLAPTVRFLTEVLVGIPSIIAGIVAYALIVLTTKQFSALAGGVALAIIFIPVVTRSTEEQLRLVPATLREAGFALGIPKWRVITGVVIPSALGGITTGVMLSAARVAGEAAPLLFTAFGSQFWPTGITESPVAALPLYIYRYAISPQSDWQAQAWGAALLLLLLVLGLNIMTRSLARSGMKRGERR